MTSIGCHCNCRQAEHLLQALLRPTTSYRAIVGAALLGLARAVRAPARGLLLPMPNRP